MKLDAYMSDDECQSLKIFSGRVRSGLARAEALPAPRRVEIARKAAAARWGRTHLKATHKGNFKTEFGIDVDCYVLDDPQRTAVISQSGMGRALGLSSRGNAFPRFLTSNSMASAVGAELRQKIENPIKFQWGTGGAGQPPAIINGFNVALIIDLCNVILEVDAGGHLAPNQKGVAKQARIILNASGKSGITRLVYDLVGYSPSAEETIAAFKMYVQEEARTYEREFPNELYREWYRLYGIPVPGKGKPWLFKHLTVRHIYFPLAKSNGKILTLVRALKASDGDVRKKLFQFLSEIGARALGRHIGRVQEMAESSDNATAYEAKINERFGDQREIDLVMPAAPLPAPAVNWRPASEPLPLFERLPGALPE
jgi:hypothetical protein